MIEIFEFFCFQYADFHSDVILRCHRNCSHIHDETESAMLWVDEYCLYIIYIVPIKSFCLPMLGKNP